VRGGSRNSGIFGLLPSYGVFVQASPINPKASRLLFATDRDVKKRNVIDAKVGSVVATAPLASGPDYVRYVSTTGEVWVTEPSAARIEIFSLPQNCAPEPAHADFISVPGGPESLVIDNKRERAYTHLWTDTAVAIDLKSRKSLRDGRWSGPLFFGFRQGDLP